MSRKRKAPVRKVYPDPKFHSEIVSKFINSIMYARLTWDQHSPWHI